jgi:hypothetical protein
LLGCRSCEFWLNLPPRAGLGVTSPLFVSWFRLLWRFAQPRGVGLPNAGSSSSFKPGQQGGGRCLGRAHWPHPARRVEYAQDVDGFWLEPHTGLGVKTFTTLLYLSTE